VRRDWERTAGPWERWEPQVMYALSGILSPLLHALDLHPGQRVLDFACGSGEPALSIAPWVTPGGSVVGIDVSAPLLAVARRRARALRIRNVRFRTGDVGRLRERPAAYDRAVSRFGLMFVEDVPATLKRVRACLKPGGRLALAVWGPAARNAAFTLTVPVLQRLTGEPPPDPERVPHPLRLARSGRLARLLREAGFRDVRTGVAHASFVYASAEEFARERLACSAPLRNVFRTLSAAQRRRVVAAIARAAGRHRDGAMLRLPAMAWIVSARR
jgi:ubiquinone/menaquinone biosynthesis C-methylase UbiE